MGNDWMSPTKWSKGKTDEYPESEQYPQLKAYPKLIDVAGLHGTHSKILNGNERQHIHHPEEELTKEKIK